jgi:hypothetical protein
MLTRALRGFLAVVLACGTTLIMLTLAAGPAAACITGADANQVSQFGANVGLSACTDDPASSSPDPTNPSNSGGVTQPACTLTTGFEIDCFRDGLVWSNSRQCYEGIVDTMPPQSNPVWQGNTDGLIIVCSGLACIDDGGASDRGGPPCRQLTYWANRAPGETVTAPEIAQQAVASMALHAGAIGTAPPPITVKPDSMAIIGIPVWLWVADPGESTTGPITRTASVGRVSITATATLDRITYDMGDGSMRTCEGPNAAGTAYTSGQGGLPSPTCGHIYTRTSGNQPDTAYTITATSQWSITWSATTGESGAFPLTFTNTTQLRVGELQTIITG